jgi:hypothetical protein
MPAGYIVDRESIMRYAEYDPDCEVRPQVQHFPAALRQL